MNIKLTTFLILFSATILKNVNTSPQDFLSGLGSVTTALGSVMKLGPMKPKNDREKGGGITGFLGIENMQNPVMQMKKKLPPSPIPEPSCVRTHFMGPYSQPVTFFAAGNVSVRLEPGTEPCIPILNCPHFKLDDTDGKCEEYLEVFDGNTGLQKYCGETGPVNVSAAGGLRDLYLTYTTVKQTHLDPEKANAVKFSCTVSCSNRGAGTSLTKSFEPKTNLRCSCGVKPEQTRIVNGEEARKGEFPWQAALVRAKTRQPFCGASIINDRIILTAAHCIKGPFMILTNFEVVLGGHTFDSTPNLGIIKGPKPKPLTYDAATLEKLDAGNGTVRFSLEEIIIHPLYVTETNDFDVALLRLSTPIDFKNYTYLSPICVPKLGSYLRTYSERMATVAGWGLASSDAKGTPTKLQKVDVKVMTPKKCREFYAHRISHRMMCAGHEEGFRDSCMGDSGGAIILEDRPQVWFQIGIVSWGVGCAAAKNPGAYCRTTEVGQWIHYHSNLNNAEWCNIPSQKSY